MKNSVQFPMPSLKQSILTGGIGFSLVSLLVFTLVAFAQRWMFERLGVTGAYLVWIALFILLGGRALSSLAAGHWGLVKFYGLFGAAFFAYGASWMASYFTLRGMAGQWLGALSGSVAMAVVFAAGFGALRSAPILCLLLFVTNSIGYFLGSFFYYSWGRPAGLMLWGAFYGGCLGGGIGAVIYLARSRSERLPTPVSSTAESSPQPVSDAVRRNPDL
jgi:hypothetical protein